MPASLHEVGRDLHASSTIANLSVALYMLSLAISPLWWSSFSERFGRRTIYIVSFAMFVFFAGLAATSINMTMLVVSRILAGAMAGSVQAVGAGTIADIWSPHERGRAMGIFYLGPLMGPLLAPILGGALTTAWGWRSTQWFLAAYGSLSFVLVLLALPETLARPPSLPRNSCVVSGPLPRRIGRTLHRFFLEPLKIILYLRFPAVGLTVFYASLTFASLYMLQISLQATFIAPPYSFSTQQVGFVYLPPSLGYVLVSLLGGRWTDHIMAREARRAGRVDACGQLILRPEDRMRENAWLAAVLYPAALVVFGWTVRAACPWPVPLAATFFYGVGCMLIFSTATTMLTELLPRRASAGVALNNLMRNVASAAAGIATEPLLGKVGAGVLFSIVGAVCLAAATVVWAMRRYGEQWRREMEQET